MNAQVPEKPDIRQSGELKSREYLSALACIIAGKSVPLAVSTNRRYAVSYDGDKLIVSSSLNSQDQQRAIISQSLLIRLGTFQSKECISLMGKRKLQQRFLLLELSRAVTKYHQQLPRSYLKEVQPFISGLSSNNAHQSLSLSKSYRQLAQPPHWLGGINPLQLSLRQIPVLGERLSSEELDALQTREVPSPADGEDDDHHKDNFWQYLTSPMGKDGLFSKALRDLLDMSSSSEGAISPGSGGTTLERATRKKVAFLQDCVNAVRSTVEFITDEQLLEQHQGNYPEWHFKKNCYLPDWVTVEEVEAYSNNECVSDLQLTDEYVLHTCRAISGLVFSLSRQNGEMDGDNFDLNRLIDFQIDRVIGVANNPKLYQAQYRNQRDMGVQLLVDVSSSTLELASDDRPIAHHHLQLSWILCQALSLLGHRVALHGFSSWGRKLVRLQRIKHFNDPSGAFVQQRLKNTSVAGYTRLGAGIRYGVEHLEKHSGASRRLLILVCDGFPYDDQYEGRYAQSDTQKALLEARSRGVATVCLSAGSDLNHQRLSTVFGESNCIAVDAISKFPPVLERVIVDAFTQLKV